MGAYGLQSHIWNNNLKSFLLLAGFPMLLCLMMFGLALLFVGFAGDAFTLEEAIREAFKWSVHAFPFAFLAAGAWFVIAFLFHSKIIEKSSGSQHLDRTQAPEIYNLLENLCIERGLSIPKLNIIESPMLNAFASGISDKSYTVTLTRGIIERLDRDELQAVIAHELTHIRNRDVRLLIISTIFVGIFSFIGEMFYRNLFRVGRHTGGYSRGRNGDSRGGGAIILVALVIIIVAYLLATAIRFALSRKREYLADAGAVDLTRNPDAMISALEKISGHSKLDIPNDVAQMCLDNDVPFAGVFSTHPTIEKRIIALQKYGGGG